MAISSQPLEDLAKQIQDLDDLVRLLGKSLTGSEAWRRHLSGQLSEVERLMQVLRMTVAMERPDVEIQAAAAALHAGCRSASLSAAGSRADLTVKASLRLAVQLSQSICGAMTGQ